MNLVVEFLRAEHFYSQENQNVYAAMLSFEKQQPIDVITLQNQLKKEGKLKDIGGNFVPLRPYQHCSDIGLHRTLRQNRKGPLHKT
ncbi:MAG: hypothetical protein IPF67_18005 [Saprospiraceae bacterium]|nr:hypothetical protein [Candidatus Brachybacter algidus]